MFKKINSKSGFSIIELMVVVVIIGVLAALAGNRILSAVARARQAEAKTNLSQIHQLQGTFQLHSDNFAQWDLNTTSAVGYQTGNAVRGCTIAASASAAATGSNAGTGADGAYELGWKPKGCEEMRYAYGVYVDSQGGIERFLAVAYAPSDTTARVYPTCDGDKRASAPTTVKHEISAYQGALDITKTGSLAAAKQVGDFMSVSDEKTWRHDDIIKQCE